MTKEYLTIVEVVDRLKVKGSDLEMEYLTSRKQDG